MPYDPERHHRRSIRLRGYDYSQAGAYFVTICTDQREPLFGEVVDGNMALNPFGGIVDATWNDLPNHFSHVELDAFVIMPNHVHGIIVLTAPVGAGLRPAPTRSGVGPAPTRSGVGPAPTRSDVGPAPTRSDVRPAATGDGKRPPLSEIVRAFKSFSARRINELRGTLTVSVWQRSYYEHIIRNEQELNKIRQYIDDNPVRWALDRENPANVSANK
jgi:REP element-mobilizing transposase RayT